MCVFVLGISSVVHQVQALQLLMLLLPEAHRETLRVSVHHHSISDNISRAELLDMMKSDDGR